MCTNVSRYVCNCTYRVIINKFPKVNKSRANINDINDINDINWMCNKEPQGPILGCTVHKYMHAHTQMVSHATCNGHMQRTMYNTGLQSIIHTHT